MTAGQLPALVPLSEREFMAQVVDLAMLLGWDWLHLRPARTAHGWVTPISGTLGAGFPDLTLVRVRDQRLLLVELKADRGTVRPEQHAVHGCLRAAGLDVRVWRPRDWDDIVEVLR